MSQRRKILITGRVQGIGFRPAVYRLATRLDLTGFVYNDTKGVTVEVQGNSENLSEFVNRLSSANPDIPMHREGEAGLKAGNDLPALSDIRTLDVVDIDVVDGESEFVISQSDSEGTALLQVTADIAACEDCLREMREPKDFRYAYPFINCTNCGPRYSIVKTIPYDRPNTTMSEFAMCEQCASQYKDVADRRFHAQPVACPVCGPKIWLTDNKGNPDLSGEKENDQVVRKAARMLLDGNILAIKGIGGFHLAVNALDNEAVLRLRERKKRDHKPFAMMADSIEKIKNYALVDELAEKVLKSAESPIVLLPKKEPNGIAESVAEGVSSFGFMLCYAPLHYMLFAPPPRLVSEDAGAGEGLEILVMTSGNISDEPLICKNALAIERLGAIADAFVMHDREIYRQVDDSIVHFIDGQPVLLRRARGYVPTPIITNSAAKKDVFAAGADMKNTFCLVKRNQMICSEHIGDLEDAEVYHHYVDSVGHLKQLFEIKPEVIVCDLHPGYLSSSRFIGTQSLKNVELIRVQHHWAHIASVLAEYELDEKVIGLECDGTGYGTDGKIWGCECLIADLEGFERFGHLAYYPLPGGDAASKEAIRSVLGLLTYTYGERFNLEKFSWLLDRIEPDKQKQWLIVEQIRKGINTIDTSSLGRVFDAVAAMVGLGSKNNFEAQLPMALEAAISGTPAAFLLASATLVARRGSRRKQEAGEQNYDFEIVTKSKPALIDLRKMICRIIDDVQAGTDVSVISAKFHNTLAEALSEMAGKAREATELNKVALSGGVFCNRYLANRLIKTLKKDGFDVLFNSLVPSNDGGISLGQAAIGAKRVGQRETLVRRSPKGEDGSGELCV
ncbi:MAG: carbamoyltransferase HypF [Sedimentisphaerales bacterium]|nr:carbamoyltransferase HypF [Sedimentisphaerales bacterium]